MTKIKTEDYDKVFEYGFTGFQAQALQGNAEALSRMLSLIRKEGGDKKVFATCCLPKNQLGAGGIVSSICGQLICALNYPERYGKELPRYYLCFLMLRSVLGYSRFIKQRRVKEIYRRKEEVVQSFFGQATLQQREALATYAGAGARAKEYLLYLSYLLEDKNSGRLHQFVSELSSTLIMDFYKSSEKEKARLQRWANDHKLIELALTYYQSGELRLGDDSEEKLDQAACVVHLLAKSLGVEVGDYQVDVIYQSAIERAEKFYEKDTLRLFGITV